MWKWAAIVLLSMTVAACNTNDNKDNLNEEAADLVTPYDNNNNNNNDNGYIDGVNDGTNGSDRGVFINGDEANVESPTSNKDNGVTPNNGNDVNQPYGTDTPNEGLMNDGRGNTPNDGATIDNEVKDRGEKMIDDK